MTRHSLKRLAGALLRGVLVLASIAVAVYLVADQVYWRTLQERRLAFQERFGAVDFRDFIPERPAPEADAGRIYQYAAARLARADRAHGDWSLFHVLLEGPKGFSENTGEQVPLVSAEEAASRAAAKLEALDAVWPVLRHADTKVVGALLHFDPTTKIAPELDEIQDLARILAAKAVAEARAGNVDEACRWLESGLHLADLMRDQPTMIALMVRVGCLQTSARAFEAVVNATPEPLPLRPTYFEAWDRAADLQWFVRSLASESVFTWSIELPGTWRLERSRYLLQCAAYFEQIVDALETPMARAPGARGATADDRVRAFSETLTASRVGTATQSAPLEALAEVEASILSKFTQRPATAEARREAVKPPSHAAAAGLSLGLIRASQSYFRLPVMRDQIRIAMALRAYHADHGAYPAQLEDLVPDYLESVPEDAISGESFQYQHEDDGVVLKSALIAVHDVQLRLNIPKTRSEIP